MLALLDFISYLLTLYISGSIAMAVLSWLVAFDVVNSRNHIVHTVGEFLYRITEPFYGQYGACCPILVASIFRL